MSKQYLITPDEIKVEFNGRLGICIDPKHLKSALKRSVYICGIVLSNIHPSA